MSQILVAADPNNPIAFSQGDDEVVLNLRCVDGNNVPIDISAATNFATQIMGPEGELVSIPTGQHAIVDGPNGEFSVTLTSDQTGGCATGQNKDIVTQVVDAGVTLYYHGSGILTVNAGAPTQ